jgi:HEAT repeat protein
MTAPLAAMEDCLRLGSRTDDASLRQLLERLRDSDWRVRFAAAVALGERRASAAVEPLLELLTAEDAAPLYGQKQELGGTPAGCHQAPTPEFPPGTDTATRDAWARRGRLKQAACLALGAIGKATPEVLARLHRYVTDQGEDYPVRAASAKALGLFRQAASRPHLERATADPEWCTMTEARKALAALGG